MAGADPGSAEERRVLLRAPLRQRRAPRGKSSAAGGQSVRNVLRELAGNVPPVVLDSSDGELGIAAPDLCLGDCGGGGSPPGPEATNKKHGDRT